MDIGNEITSVFTKFDKQAIKLKRAFSMIDMVNQHHSEDTLDGTRSETTEDSTEEYIFRRRYSFPIEGLEQDVLDPQFE